MSTDYKQNLEGLGGGVPLPSIEDVSVLKPMRRGPAVSIMRSQDTIACLSRRGVLHSGLDGAAEWRVPNTTADSASNTHPDRTTWYTVGHGLCEVTPGCFYRLHGLAVPGGETQVFIGAGDYDPDGRTGEVRVTIVWTDANGTTETTTHTKSLPGSTREFGAEVVSAGGLFSSLIAFEIDGITPPDIFSDVQQLRRWCFHITAQVTVEHRGSPRIVDLELSEIPIAFAQNGGIADASYWTNHVYAHGTPFSPGPKPIYPLTRNATTQTDDPRGGTEHILEVARAQALRLGPCLAQWTAYNEEDAVATQTIVPVTRQDDGDRTFKALLNESQTGYDETEPGWSLGCGGYGRRWAHNNPRVLGERCAVIPVLFRVLAVNIAGGTSATVRFQSALHSYVDVQIVEAEEASWQTAYGWLRVSINPDQIVIGQALCNHTGGSGQLDVYAFQVYQTGYFEAQG